MWCNSNISKNAPPSPHTHTHSHQYNLHQHNIQQVVLLVQIKLQTNHQLLLSILLLQIMVVVVNVEVDFVHLLSLIRVTKSFVAVVVAASSCCLLICIPTTLTWCPLVLPRSGTLYFSEILYIFIVVSLARTVSTKSSSRFCTQDQ